MRVKPQGGLLRDDYLLRHPHFLFTGSSAESFFALAILMLHSIPKP